MIGPWHNPDPDARCNEPEYDDGEDEAFMAWANEEAERQACLKSARAEYGIDTLNAPSDGDSNG